jgi:hypothetical protein
MRDTGKYFCSKECLNEYRKKPENNPCWKGGKTTKQCVVCGELFTVPKKDYERRKTCCMECRNVYISEWQKKFSWLIGLPSELHPNWNGGTSFELYPKEFFDIRVDILKRDDYKCVECNSETNLCVHHIDYDKTNNEKENLITLCGSCHAKTNFKREQWKKRYQSYAIQRYKRNA